MSVWWIVHTPQLIICNSRWADEGTVFWGVEEYPDMEAYQKKVEVLEKLELYREGCKYSIKMNLGGKFR